MKMKKLFIIFLCCLGILQGYAQDMPRVGAINIGLVVPDETDELSDSAITKLRAKLTQILTVNNVASSAYGGFVIYPLISIDNLSVIEGGMRNIVVADIEITLCLKQLGTKITIGSYVQKVRGSGNNEAKAIFNAISAINPSQKEFKSFIDEGCVRIVQYYTEQRSVMIKKAKELAAKQQYEEALYLLMSYPESLAGYDEVSAVSIEIFNKYQNYYCSQLIQDAKAHISLKEYESAINILMSIDANSKCKVEANSLIKQVERSVEKEDARALQVLMKVYETEANLEKQRINAVKEVAKAYYSNQPTINYTQIIRL